MTRFQLRYLQMPEQREVLFEFIVFAPHLTATVQFDDPAIKTFSNNNACGTCRESFIWPAVPNLPVSDDEFANHSGVIGGRTRNLQTASLSLSQLSYNPIKLTKRLELLTSSIRAKRTANCARPAFAYRRPLPHSAPLNDEVVSTSASSGEDWRLRKAE